MVLLPFSPYGLSTNFTTLPQKLKESGISPNHWLQYVKENKLAINVVESKDRYSRLVRGPSLREIPSSIPRCELKSLINKSLFSISEVLLLVTDVKGRPQTLMLL